MVEIVSTMKVVLWRSIQHNNTTPLSKFCFFWNFTIGQTGSNMFCRISPKLWNGFRLNFLYGQGGHPTLFWNKQKGGLRRNLAPLAPSKLGASATSTPTTPTITPSVKLKNHQIEHSCKYVQILHRLLMHKISQMFVLNVLLNSKTTQNTYYSENIE